MYLTYNEYVNMGGGLNESAFTALEFRARRAIDIETSRRLVNHSRYSETVKRCVFELIGAYENEDNLCIKNASNDGVSVTYADTDINSITNNLIYEYLAGEKNLKGLHLLYLGVR